jgi:hypothetical protein
LNFLLPAALHGANNSAPKSPRALKPIYGLCHVLFPLLIWCLLHAPVSPNISCRTPWYILDIVSCESTCTAWAQWLTRTASNKGKLLWWYTEVLPWPAVTEVAQALQDPKQSSDTPWAPLSTSAGLGSSLTVLYRLNKC